MRILIEEERFIRIEKLLTRIAEAIEHLVPPVDQFSDFGTGDIDIDEFSPTLNTQEEEDALLDRFVHADRPRNESAGKSDIISWPED